MIPGSDPRVKRFSNLPLVLIFAVIFAVTGACIDVYYEWPVRVPGDPPSSLYTFRYAAGVSQGWIFYSSDDIFAHDNLQPGFRFDAHPPVFRMPAGAGGWTDFGIYGVAPWFLSAVAALLVSVLRAIRG